MKSILNNTLLRTLALGICCLGAGVANAQPFQGKFSLPFEVRWGAATLQPGDYAFNVEGARTGNTLQLTRNGKVVATLLAQAHNPSGAGPAALVIDSGKSGSTVREMRLPDIGVVLCYSPHKASAAEERAVAQLIPIAAIVATR